MENLCRYSGPPWQKATITKDKICEHATEKDLEGAVEGYFEQSR